ncbi:MAG: SIR2 family protein [Candidatus Marithrix sp.]
MNNKKLAVFIGAGVSRLVGCDGWDALARNLVKKCFDEGFINFKEQETLSQTSEHKKTITICYHVFKKKNCENTFYEEMEKALKEGEDIKIPNIYNDIYKLGGLFITTNADTHFDRLFNPENIGCQIQDFNANQLDNTKLLKIHGSIEHRSSLVFTVSEYMKRYTNEIFREFLAKIFNEYIVLFLGYGVSEFEILDFMFQNRDQDSDPRHFMLSPFYKGEDNILAYEQAYYNDLGVKIIPYEMDVKGYHQLIDVIEHWNKEIRQITSYLSNNVKVIDNAIENILEDKILETLQIIKNDKTLEDYFLKKLAEALNPIRWLIPLYEAKYFEPKNNPKPQAVPDKKDYYTTPYWNVLGTLENIALKNEENPIDEISKLLLKDEIFKLLLKIVDGIIEYTEDGEKINNYRTNWKLLDTISHFPIKYISKQHVQFVKEKLDFGISISIGKYFLPKLVQSKATDATDDLILNLLDIILDYKKPLGKEYDKYISVIKPYKLKDILDKNKKKIAKICAVEAANIGIKKIQDIVKEDKSQFNYVSIPTIENHKQTRNINNYKCQLIHFVRDMFEAVKPEESIVKNMLNEEHFIFKRLAYHLINYHYNSLSHLFWNISYNPLNISGIHELYEFFKAHCNNFDETQIETIINWIETQDFSHCEDRKNINETKAYYKKEWLHALLKSNNEKVKQLYYNYNFINDEKIKHPGFHYWSGGAYSVRYISPIDDENEFKKKTNDEIVEYINSYKEDLSQTGPVRVNLASAIRDFIVNDPVRFSTNLTPFLSIPREYQHEFLVGFKKLWENNRDFDCEELLSFIENLIKSNDFWNETSNYNRWIVNIIVDLIDAGTGDDKHAFSPNLLPIAERIILILLAKVENEMNMMNDSIVDSVINSSKGKMFIAAINYSLRYARLNRQNTENKWIESIKSEFTKRLDKSIESGLEFSVIIGWYLRDLIYLDEQWVIDNFNKIFDLESDKHWEAAFTGHIVMESSIYEEIYNLLRYNGHYEKWLSQPFDDKSVADKLVQNIVIGYLAEWDDLEDAGGLINKVFATDNTEYISEIISFMWSYKNKGDEKFKNKVNPLWKVIINKITTDDKLTLNSDKGYHAIASDLAKWLSIVDSIDDDIYKWLQISMEVMGENDDSHSLLAEYLLKHVKTTPTKVGKLYLKMIDSDVYLDYKKEDITATINFLYNSDEKEIANRICNSYLSKGFDFLRDTFEKYNKS